MPQKFRLLLSLLIKAAISALLLYLSLRWVDVAAVSERLGRANGGWLLTVFFICLMQSGVLLALRWRQIVIATGTPLTPRAAMRYSLIAAFFNQTLPSTVGGDASRIWMLARNESGWRNATYSVLIDRGVGLFALAVVVLALLPWTLSLIQDPVARIGVIAIGLLGVGGFIAFSGLGLAERFLDRWWATRHVVAAARLTWRVFGRPSTGLLVAVLSLAIHFASVTTIWAAAQAISAPLTFVAALSIVPPVILISTVPISIAGWGVRESAMIAAFAYAGLAQSDGLLVSLIFGAANFAVGALGGIVWVVSGERQRRKELQQAAAAQDLR